MPRGKRGRPLADDTTLSDNFQPVVGATGVTKYACKCCDRLFARSTAYVHVKSCRLDPPVAPDRDRIGLPAAEFLSPNGQWPFRLRADDNVLAPDGSDWAAPTPQVAPFVLMLYV